MPGYDFHSSRVSDLSTRLSNTGAWFGVVEQPDDQDVVPVILVPSVGVVDSLTYARDLVLVSQPLSRHMSSEGDDRWSGQGLQDIADEWESIAEPLLDDPAAGTVAAVIVALQCLAVEVGREWLSAGLDPEKLMDEWDQGAGDSDPGRGLVEWVVSRWKTEGTKGDRSLHPGRVLELELEVEVMFSLTKSLAYGLADIAIAAEDGHPMQFVALHPWLRAVRPEDGQGVSAEPMGFPGDHWEANWDEPPF